MRPCLQSGCLNPSPCTPARPCPAPLPLPRPAPQSLVRGLGLAPTLSSATLAATLFAPSDFGFPDALVGLVDQGPANGTLPGMVDLPDALRQVGARGWVRLARVFRALLPLLSGGPLTCSSPSCPCPPPPTHTKAARGPPVLQAVLPCIYLDPPLCPFPSPSPSCCPTTCTWAPACCPTS